MTRPIRLVVVTGTGTEIGKTWVSAAALRVMRAGARSVAARKPLQSFTPGEGPTDAEVLAAATGEPVTEVCSAEHNYPIAMAPPMAASTLGLDIPTIAALVEHITASWPDAAVDVGLVEGAGGVASPLAADGDTRGLVAGLRPDLTVLVAGPGLGTINLVRLCTAALEGHEVVIHLNRWDPAIDLHRANLAWLRSVDRLRVTTSIKDLSAAMLGSPDAGG
jgi:dethiobiotin synthetase